MKTSATMHRLQKVACASECPACGSVYASESAAFLYSDETGGYCPCGGRALTALEKISHGEEENGSNGDQAPVQTRRKKVLVAVEPRTYRESIGWAIQILRPHLEVDVVSPEALGSAIGGLDHGVVICGRPAPEVIGDEVDWIEYRPYDMSAKLRLGGRHSEIEEVTLSGLLLALDARLEAGNVPAKSGTSAKKFVRGDRKKRRGIDR